MFVLSTLLVSSFCSYAEADNFSYVMAARQRDLLRSQDRISDMAANVNTTGFKLENDIYGEFKKPISDKSGVTFPSIKTTARDYSQGGLATTGRPLDVAISGPGFFMINTPNGMRYTRAGNFKTNSEGVLVTKDDYPVIGPGGGQVEFTEEDINITIRENGLVSSGPEERGQIGVFIFPDERLLIREANGLYNTTQQPIPTEDSLVVQGVLENSNVNSVTSMANLIEVSRQIETNAKLQESYSALKTNLIRTLTQ